MAVAATAAVAALSVGTSAHADDYVPSSPPTSDEVTTTVRDQGAPTTTGATSTDPTTTAKLPALPTTGSDATSPLQMGGVALLAGAGLVAVASVRRRKTA